MNTTILSPSSVRRFLRLGTGRGFTLIEIMLVLVISSIVISGLFKGYWELEKNNRNKEATRQMETIKEAIVAYAATHQTTGREIYVQVSGEAPRRVIIPEGRPYLPCPDITGDGLEDRVTLADAAIDLTLAVPALNAARTAYESMDASDLLNYQLWYPGSCFSSRGIVPWRTLKTPPTDPWGNRHTYRVTPAFAGAGTGFDQNQQAINVGAAFMMNPSTVAIAATIFVEGTSTPISVTNVLLNPPIALPRGVYQGVIDGHVSAPRTNFNVTVNFVNSGPYHVYLAPAVICSETPCPPLDNAPKTNIVAGEVIESDLTVTFPQLVNFPGGTRITFSAAKPQIAGVPFVVLSHGRNGYGAVDGQRDGGYHCHSFPAKTTAQGDDADPLGIARNAEENNAAFNNVFNSTCPSIAVPGQNIYVDYGFIAGINSSFWSDGRLGYDDIVSWMSTEDLAAELSTLGVFPARRFPLLTDQPGL